MRSILSRVGVEKGKKDITQGRYQVLNHRIFNAINDVVRALDKMEFVHAKDIIGKSLREDYSIIE
jgi:hypothetical protein